MQTDDADRIDNVPVIDNQAAGPYRPANPWMDVMTAVNHKLDTAIQHVGDDLHHDQNGLWHDQNTLMDQVHRSGQASGKHLDQVLAEFRSVVGAVERFTAQPREELFEDKCEGRRFGRGEWASLLGECLEGRAAKVKAELQREKKRHLTYNEIVIVLDKTYKMEWGQRKVKEEFKK